MRYRQPRERIDFGVYPQALFLLLRNPIIMLGPILSSVLMTLVSMLGARSGGIFGAATIFGLLQLVLLVFGLAMATIIADMVWRRGRTSFDEAWEESRRKAGDIVFAGLGLSMLFYVAQYLGSIFSGILGLVLGLVALAVFIYAIPAATIGGISGGLSLQASLDIAKSRPVNTFILAIVSGIAIIGIGFYLPAYLFSYLGNASESYFTIFSAVMQAVAMGYVATCLSKRYADASFRNL